MKKKLKVSFIIVSLALTLFTANYCLAVSSVVDTSNPGYSEGNYTLNNVRDYVIYLMQLILGLVGTLSLLMFVYGGLTFLLSAGNSNSVKKGMEILKASVVGLLLVFSSVLIIQLFFGGIFGTNKMTNKSGTTWNSKTGTIENYK